MGDRRQTRLVDRRDRARELGKELLKLWKTSDPDGISADGRGEAHAHSLSHGRLHGMAHKGAGAPPSDTLRPSQAWKLGTQSEEGREEGTVLQCEIDELLNSVAAARKMDAEAGAEAREPVVLRKDEVKQVQHELGGLHQRLARDQLGFLDSRNDAGAVQDRLIIKRRFGQGEKRTMLVGGVAFEA